MFNTAYKHSKTQSASDELSEQKRFHDISAWKPQAIILERTQVAHKKYWTDSELIFLVKAFMVLALFQDK